MIGAGEIERRTSELGGQSLAFERRGHFGVLQHQAIRESAISNKRAKPIHRGLEAVGLLIVGDSHVVQVQLHTAPGSDGFLAALMESSRAQNSISNPPSAKRLRSPVARC